MGDEEPRPEFAAALREWFVDEVGRPPEDGADIRRHPTASEELVPVVERDDRRRRSSRSWLLLANAAAVAGIVVGLLWLTNRSGQTPEETPVATAPAESSDPVAVAASVCADYRRNAPRLVMGATAQQVEEAALDVRAALREASESLGAAGSGDGLDEARRLAAESLDAADRLLTVADADVVAVDSAVENLDLLITAWSRELALVAGEECGGLPTLRKVF